MSKKEHEPRHATKDGALERNFLDIGVELPARVLKIGSRVMPSRLDESLTYAGRNPNNRDLFLLKYGARDNHEEAWEFVTEEAERIYNFMSENGYGDRDVSPGVPEPEDKPYIPEISIG